LNLKNKNRFIYSELKGKEPNSKKNEY